MSPRNKDGPGVAGSAASTPPLTDWDASSVVLGMAEIESRDDGVIIPIKRLEAVALTIVAEIGLDADDTLARIRNTATAGRALNALKASRGSLSLRRPEAAALIAVAETGLALANAPRGRFALLFEAIDLDAARRGLDELRGALR